MSVELSIALLFSSKTIPSASSLKYVLYRWVTPVRKNQPGTTLAVGCWKLVNGVVPKRLSGELNEQAESTLVRRGQIEMMEAVYRKLQSLL